MLVVPKHFKFNLVTCQFRAETYRHTENFFPSILDYIAMQILKGLFHFSFLTIRKIGWRSGKSLHYFKLFVTSCMSFRGSYFFSIINKNVTEKPFTMPLTSFWPWVLIVRQVWDRVLIQGQGPVLEGPKTFSHPKSRSKISNLSVPSFTYTQAS